MLVHVSTPLAFEALAARVQQVGPELAHQELSLAIREAALAVDRAFGAGPRASARATEHTTPLDRDYAGETFEEYFREQVAKPEYHGMTTEMQKQVRGMLAKLPLFGIDKDGDWSLMEEVGDDVWAMAQATLERERKFAASQTGSPARPHTTVASRIPPTAATRSPVGNGATRTATKKPREFANPFDAVRYADTSAED